MKQTPDKVVVVGCESYEPECVEKALNELIKPFSELCFIKPNAKIVIKANLVSMMKPESAATTHPQLLYALCKYLVGRGAQVVVGDSPGGLFNSAYVNRVYSVCGLKAILETGAALNQNFEHVQAQNPDGKILKQLDYTTYLDEADAIINFCKLKTHGMMGMSACVKNMFGSVPGTFKPEYHYKFPKHEDFADMLIDLNERFKPSLCIVDAVIGMEGNGPTAGTPRKIGAILASQSPYCLDEVCAGIIGLKPEEVPTIVQARKRGLVGEYEITGNPDKYFISDYKLVRDRKDMSFNRELPGILGKAFGSFVQMALCSVPKVKSGECVGCKKCFEICPAKAIEMQNNRPKIDRSKCIRCFCCQEFCPKGAMKVHRPPIARLINRQ